MKAAKRMIANIVEIVFGVILTILGYTGVVDSYWSGMGTALIFVGIIFLFRTFRYKTNTEYKEKVDVEVNDERNKYLRMMAWSWTGYFFVLIAAFASIIFRIFGYNQYSMMAGYAVCLLIALYWISFLILRRKH
jgi:hypothetical protein